MCVCLWSVLIKKTHKRSTVKQQNDELLSERSTSNWTQRVCYAKKKKKSGSSPNSDQSFLHLRQSVRQLSAMPIYFSDTVSHWQTDCGFKTDPSSYITGTRSKMSRLLCTVSKLLNFNYMLAVNELQVYDLCSLVQCINAVSNKRVFTIIAQLNLLTTRVLFWSLHRVRLLDKFSDTSGWFSSSVSWFIYFLQSEPLELRQTHKCLLYCSFPSTKCNLTWFCNRVSDADEYKLGKSRGNVLTDIYTCAVLKLSWQFIVYRESIGLITDHFADHKQWSNVWLNIMASV